MRRRSLAALALAALLLVTGCSAVPGGGSAGLGASPTPAGPVYELPATGQALADAHEEALHTAGSFTADTNVTTRDGEADRSLSVVATTAVDVERGAVLLDATVAGTDRTVYVDPNGTGYQRTTAGGESTYQRLDEAPDVGSLYALPVASLVDEANLSYAGRDRVAGVPVAVYEVTDLESVVAPSSVGTIGAVDTESLESFEARLSISADGLVRRLHYHVELRLDGSTRAITLTVTFREVGVTTVDAPDWLDEVP